MEKLLALKVLLDATRRSAASVGLPIRPRQFLEMPLENAVEIEDSASPSAPSAPSLTPNKIYYMPSRAGTKCVLQIHDASRLQFPSQPQMQSRIETTCHNLRTRCRI